MELKRFFQQQKKGKFHPSWILLVVALTVIIAGIVWIPAWLVPRVDGKPDRLPYLMPTSAKIIMVNEDASKRDKPDWVPSLARTIPV